MAEETTNYSHIEEDFNSRNNKLDKQITSIELRQQEIQTYLSHIDASVNFIDNEISTETNKKQPNYDRIKALRAALSKNIEILNDLHNTYKEYEGVKFRYYKEIDDNSIQKHKLIELELRKLDDKLNDYSDGGFIQMMQTLVNQIGPGKKDEMNNNSNLNDENILENARNEMNEDPSLKL